MQNSKKKYEKKYYKIRTKATSGEESAQRFLQRLRRNSDNINNYCQLGRWIKDRRDGKEKGWHGWVAEGTGE